MRCESRAAEDWARGCEATDWRQVTMVPKTSVRRALGRKVEEGVLDDMPDVEA